MKRRFFMGIVGLVLSAMLCVGCTGGNVKQKTLESTTQDSKKQKVKKESVKITIVGSTTIAEPMEKLIGAYKESGSTDNIEVQGNGSSAGIKAAIDGVADIGMSSRELSEEEKSKGLVETTIAYDGIAIVVNPSNDVADLTKAQIKDIFEGKVTSWSEVGGKDEEIIVVTREAGSGTRGAFEEILKILDSNKASTITDSALVTEGTGAVMATVATKEASIGFISLGYVDNTVKLVNVDGVTPSIETVKSNEYSISRPLLLVSQPTIKKEAQAVIDFIVGEEGQKIMAEKYIAIHH